MSPINTHVMDLWSTEAPVRFRNGMWGLFISLNSGVRYNLGSYSLSTYFYVHWFGRVNVYGQQLVQDI